MTFQTILQAGAVAAVLLVNGPLVQADVEKDRLSADAKITDSQTFYAEQWTGTCATGTNLSPIDVRETEVAPVEWASDFGFGVKTGIKARSTGHALQMVWDGSSGESTASVQATGSDITDIFRTVGELRTMKVEPLQMHWHSPSEHAVNGVFFAAEGHIVSAIAEGEAPEWGCDTFWQTGNASDLVLEKCIAVFGVLYSLGATTQPPLFASLIANEPLEVGVTQSVTQSVDLGTFLPERKDYIMYRGSLTTPECNQGLRWHLFDEPMTISPADQQRLQSNQANTFIKGPTGDVKLLFKTNTQYIQALNGRKVFRQGESRGVSAIATQGAAAPTPAPAAGTSAPATQAGASTATETEATATNSASLPKLQASLAAVAALALYML